jgi:hypothetical protein
MAKNLALHGVWGVTSHAFSSSTSSPLWTLLLVAVWRVVGIHDAVPLVLNTICGLLLLVVADRILRTHARASSLSRGAVLMGLVLVMPMPTIAVMGMEHTLHALLALLVAHRAAALLATGGRPTMRSHLSLFALAALLPATRYEGALMLCVVAALLIATRRGVSAALLLVCGALPMIAYGLWSMSQGWYFLPNSILLKGNIPVATGPSIVRWLYALPQALAWHAHVLFLIGAGIVLLLVALRHGRRDYSTHALGIFVLTAIAHVQFAKLGWFFRYEAYLVVTGVVFIGVALGPWASAHRLIAWTRRSSLVARALVAVLILVVASPWLIRAVSALANTVQATRNIHDQQYQMGRFLDRYYPGAAVAVNDIGAVCYIADVRLCDLWGLGTMEAAQLKRAQRFGPDPIADLTRRAGVELAIVYDDWYRVYGGVPAHWREVGTWRVAYNVVLGGDTVTIYAVAPGSEGRLVRNLREFARELPTSVVQSGAYTED